MRETIFLFLKGVAIGAANVIPGVSGGTIAFITGIYSTLINSLKSIDLEAVRLLFSFKLKEFANHINLKFLFTLFLGVGISLVTLGKLADYLFENYNILVWSFFFGLIAVSIYSVSKEVGKWSFTTVALFVVGTLVALSLSVIKPASESDASIYLVICGIIAMASMILPGLSGSFVLILLGNYQLIMLKAVPELNLSVIMPVVIGAVIGFLVLSRGISFLLDKFYDKTISILAGFILGSLAIIWPWKEELYLKNIDTGELILKKGEKIVQGYQWYFPNLDINFLYSILLMGLGVVLVLLVEFLGNKPKISNE